MSLSVEQLAIRKGKLTASRVACLMGGDDAAIFRLYREMIGEIEPADLTHNWAARLGSATEALQLDWYTETTKRALAWRNRTIIHPEYPWAAATPDAWDEYLECPVEAKHIMGWAPIQVAIDHYQPQMHFQMWVTGAKRCVLTCIRASDEPSVEYVDLFSDYMQILIDRATAFITCVQLREPPVELPPVPAPVDPTRNVDMTGNNEWGSNAALWLENKLPSLQFELSKASLKDMMPRDAKRAFGNGVQVTRSKNGALTVRPDNNEDRTNG